MGQTAVECASSPAYVHPSFAASADERASSRRGGVREGTARVVMGACLSSPKNPGKDRPRDRLTTNDTLAATAEHQASGGFAIYLIEPRPVEQLEQLIEQNSHVHDNPFYNQSALQRIPVDSADETVAELKKRILKQLDLEFPIAFEWLSVWFGSTKLTESDNLTAAGLHDGAEVRIQGVERLVGGVDVIAAAKEGSVALLSLVIRFTPEKINQVDENGDGLLHHAARFGHLETCNSLIKAGADVHATDKYKETPVHLASWAGQAEAVEALLCAGAQVDAKEKDHNTALHMAAAEGHAAVVDALIKARADIFMLDKVATKLPARVNHAQIVTLLKDAAKQAAKKKKKSKKEKR